MKREGRQHGVVRTYWLLPSPSNSAPPASPRRTIDAVPTAGFFTKVPSKPTNHSKFTGKCHKVRCITCRIHPISKSKDKTKGTQKLKSDDVVNNYQLVMWRAGGGRPALKLSGYSASGILDQLSSDYDQDYYEDDDNPTDYDYDGDDRDDGSGDAGEYGLAAYFRALPELKMSRPEIIEMIEDEEDFVDLGIELLRGEEDEGWLLIGEI